METLKLWLKQWIWQSKWVQYSVQEAIKREEVNYATRLFKNAVDDVHAGFERDVKEEAKVLADQMLSAMLSPVDLNHLVTLDKRNGLVYIGGEKADEIRLANLRAEAEALKSFELWRLIQETPKELAQKAMFMEGDSIEQMRKGRTMLYVLQTQKNIVDLLKNVQIKKGNMV